GRNKVVAPLWCGIFAGMTEFIQSFVPTRFSDPMDWVVDFTGSGIGIILFEGVLKKQLTSSLSANKTQSEPLKRKP
ncbi:MAG: VanZ family protein, partial [Candidatus Aenigmatarchaeota archaeon]